MNLRDFLVQVSLTNYDASIYASSCIPETCTRKKLVPETMSDVQVPCASRPVQDSRASFLTVYHKH